jgi:uncharacterized RDD family membrane protein YckC
MADWVEAATVEDFRGIWGKGFREQPRSEGPPPLPPAGNPAGGLQRHSGPEVDQDVPQARPWVRFFARGLDGALYGAAAVYLVAVLHPNNLLYLSAIGLGLFLLEAFAVTIFGATPGKAILGASIEAEDGNRPTFGQAIGREIAVRVYGMGLGIIFIAPFTLVSSFRTLVAEGATSWDRSRGFSVRHKRLGLARPLVAAVVSVAAFTFAVNTVLAMRRGDESAGMSFNSLSLSSIRRSLASNPAEVGASSPTTQPAGKKSKPKPKVLILSSDKPADDSSAKGTITRVSPTTRPARRKDRPPPSVQFKPEPPPAQ